MNYHNGHRLFLQKFISRKFLSEKDSKKLYSKAGNVCEVDANPDEFSNFVQVINKQLEPLFLEIRRGRSEDTGETFFALVNTIEDEHSKLATEFQTYEIDYVKKVLSLIVESEEGFVSTMDMVNCGLDLKKKVSSRAAEEILGKMTLEGWLVEKNGNVNLGARALIELGQYLKNKYEDKIHECPLCHDFVVMGDVCLECDTIVHKYCAATTFSRIPADKRKCPSCAKLWRNDVTPLLRHGSNPDDGMNSLAASVSGMNTDVPVIQDSQRGKRSSKQRNRR